MITPSGSSSHHHGEQITEFTDLVGRYRALGNSGDSTRFSPHRHESGSGFLMMRILVLARAEVQRFVGSRRGLVSLLAFCLLWYAALTWFVLPAGRLASGGAGAGIDVLLDEYLSLGNLLRWPAQEYAAWWVAALYLLPFVSVVASADQIASDRARGTLRYLILRASRLEILAGRFLGQALIMAVATLVTMLSTLALVWYQHQSLVPNTRWAGEDGVVPIVGLAALALWMTLLPWISLMALVSALARTPSQATRYALIIWIVLSIAAAWLSSRWGSNVVLDHLLPGSPVRTLLSRIGSEAMVPASIGLLHAAVFLVAAALVMCRRDL